MQQLHHLGCDWTDNGRMILHQGTDILTGSIDVVTNITHLKVISTVQIPGHCIGMILTKLTGKCISPTPCILELEIDEMVNIQNPHLVMLQVVHLKDKIEPA